MQKRQTIPELNDKKWLVLHYETKQLSYTSISLILNCKPNAVRRALIGFDIPRRKTNEVRLLFRKNDGFNLRNLSIINGSLLGDASIGGSKRSPRFTKTNKNYDHVLYVAKHIFDIDPKIRIKQITKKTKIGTLIHFRVRSLGYMELKKLLDIWYPNGKKIIPKDLSLDAETLLHLFMDDGSVQYQYIKNKEGKYRKNKNSVHIRFHTAGFTKTDNEMLCKKIKETFGLRARLMKKGPYWIIYIPNSDARNFYNIIGPCPENVPSMQYKWPVLAPKARDYPQLRDKKWLTEHYVDKKFSMSKISRTIGCSQHTVKDWLVKHNIPLRIKTGFRFESKKSGEK